MAFAWKENYEVIETSDREFSKKMSGLLIIFKWFIFCERNSLIPVFSLERKLLHL